MYDTRPSKHNLELLKSGLANVAQEETLTEGEQAAERMLIASLSLTDWILQVDDPSQSINDYAKKKLGEELDIEEALWNEGAAILLRDKFWILGKSPDRKLRQRSNVLKVNIHYPAEGTVPNYLNGRVIEAALQSVDS